MRTRTTGPLRRALPLLAFVAALLCAWLQPPPAAPAGVGGGAWTTDAPVVDTTGGLDRTAVKPKSPSQLQATTKQRLDPPGGSTPGPIVAAVDDVAETNCEACRDGVGRKTAHVPTRMAIVAQPRAPPSSRTLTPAV